MKFQQIMNIINIHIVLLDVKIAYYQIMTNAIHRDMAGGEGFQ